MVYDAQLCIHLWYREYRDTQKFERFFFTNLDCTVCRLRLGVNHNYMYIHKTTEIHPTTEKEWKNIQHINTHLQVYSPELMKVKEPSNDDILSNDLWLFVLDHFSYGHFLYGQFLYVTKFILSILICNKIYMEQKLYEHFYTVTKFICNKIHMVNFYMVTKFICSIFMLTLFIQ